MLYTSTENNKIKEIKKLNNKKYRDETGLFLVEGEHLVKEAINADLIKTLIIESGYFFENIKNIEIIEVSSSVLKYISSLDTPQPIMGICYKKSSEVIGNRILVLDNIQDPGNLGTIIRSSVAFNVDTIVLSQDSVDLYNSKVIRASQGMLFHINIIEKELKSFIKDLKRDGYNIISTDVKKGKSLKELVKKEKVVIIMGNEGNGVRKDLIDLADDFLYIKMNNDCESLNVAIATSIILYEFDK
ncbi:MAG: RNA methyltransferase [Bacilli bacterium]|nr:RNA methyltransferase [Bacilli bacterium]